MKALRGKEATRSRDEFCTVVIEGRDYCIDPLGPLFEAVGKKWSLFIVAVLGNKRTMRFGELQAALLDISPRTLSDRLKDLERAGLIRRQAFAEVPIRVEYALTRKGEALRDSLVPMLQWAERQD